MELRIHRVSGICLPGAPDPSEWARLIGDAVRRATGRVSETVRRHSPAIRLALYTAAGTATGTLAAAGGMDPSDAASLGMNVAATTAAFWPPSGTRQGCIGSEES